MALEYDNGILTMLPGIQDIHSHPRVFDPLVDHAFVERNGYEGKAGLIAYTETALKSGIAVINIMPNESYRMINPDKPGGTEIVQFPVSNAQRVAMMEISVRTQSRMQAHYYLGLDKFEILFDEGRRLDERRLFDNFRAAGKRAAGLKIFGDESTGGQNMPIEHFPPVIEAWHSLYPEKPVIMHLEDANVRIVLEMLDARPEGRKIPLHIAHVSSRDELEAVIEARARGMDITCEATPHHLFADKSYADLLGGYGCMKPTLKAANDVKFLWDNISYIDIIASDCAPHRVSDKELGSEHGVPVWGVTNHTVMMPLLLGAVDEGRLTLEDLHEKMVIMPRLRFKLPEHDGTRSVFDLRESYVSSQEAEADIDPGYGQNIFVKLEQLGKSFHLLGKVLIVESGHSRVARNPRGILMPTFRTSLEHLAAV